MLCCVPVSAVGERAVSAVGAVAEPLLNRQWVLWLLCVPTAVVSVFVGVGCIEATVVGLFRQLYRLSVPLVCLSEISDQPFFASQLLALICHDRAAAAAEAIVDGAVVVVAGDVGGALPGSSQCRV